MFLDLLPVVDVRNALLLNLNSHYLVTDVYHVLYLE